MLPENENIQDDEQEEEFVAVEEEPKSLKVLQLMTGSKRANTKTHVLLKMTTQTREMTRKRDVEAKIKIVASVKRRRVNAVIAN
jgi:hypothetical protein